MTLEITPLSVELKFGVDFAGVPGCVAAAVARDFHVRDDHVDNGVDVGQDPR